MANRQIFDIFFLAVTYHFIFSSYTILVHVESVKNQSAFQNLKRDIDRSHRLDLENFGSITPLRLKPVRPVTPNSRTITAHHKCSALPPHQALKFIISTSSTYEFYIRRALEELNSLSPLSNRYLPSCDSQCRFTPSLNVEYHITNKSKLKFNVIFMK